MTDTASTYQDVNPFGQQRLRAGVIGLGMIGGSVATNLAAAGFSVAAFDVREDAFQKVEGLDGQAASPRAVAEASDVVLIATFDAAQAMDVLVGDEGVLTAGRKDLVVVLLSTVQVPEVHRLAAVCTEHGATLLDAGVTQAGDSLLVVMLGGEKEAADRVAPVLDAFTTSVVYCGASSSGMIAKLARNAITYGGWAIVREAVAFAKAGGVEPGTILQVMDAAAQGGSGPEARLRVDVEQGGLPEQAVAYVNGLAQKDIAAAQQLAGSLDVETPILDTVRPHVAAAAGGDYGEPLPEERWDRGVVMMHRVYGGQLPEIPRDTDVPAARDTVEHLFGEVWARGHLSLRDRRLLAMGATAMLGRRDLLETQLRGALGNGELTTAQLREIEYFINYYASVENGSAVLGVVEQLIAEGIAH